LTATNTASPIPPTQTPMPSNTATATASPSPVPPTQTPVPSETLPPPVVLSIPTINPAVAPSATAAALAAASKILLAAPDNTFTMRVPNSSWKIEKSSGTYTVTEAGGAAAFMGFGSMSAFHISNSTAKISTSHDLVELMISAFQLQSTGTPTAVGEAT